MIKSKLIVAFLLAASLGECFAGDDSWFFTADEIGNAYRYQQQFGARLRNPLEPQACLQGKKDFRASYRGSGFIAPCRFVDETIRQLRELLESGAAKYLFPLDVDSADLAVPVEVYVSKYRELASAEVLPALLRDPELVAIYRTAMHLNPEPRDEDSGMKAWSTKGTVIGFYDGRQNQFLQRSSDASVDFAGLVRLGEIRIMGHFLGELTLVANNTSISFDLSFDDDRAAASTADFAAVSTAVR
jgi:hypothetical protein